MPTSSLIFFFNDTATTEIYTLSLHDALPICDADGRTAAPADGDPGEPARQTDQRSARHVGEFGPGRGDGSRGATDRKSTRLNSSHANISYAVFCLKKKKIKTNKFISTHTSA